MFLKKSNPSFLYLLLLFLFLKSTYSFSQTGIAINNTGATADVSAMLDVTSTDKGFLLPRLTTTQRDAINSPATGLVIFNSTVIGLQVNIGTPSVPIWSTLSTSSPGWGLTGNAGTNITSNFIGTTDNVGLSIRTNSLERLLLTPTGNFGVNNSNPTEKLDVAGNLRLSGAFMPNNNPGTIGLFLISTGPNSPPTWFDASNYAWQLDGNPVTSIKKFGTTTNYAVPVITNNIERMRVDINGNVGIGTTSPSAALNVVKNSSGTNIITIQNTNTGGFSSMDFYNAAGALSSTFGFANSTSGGIFSNRAYMNSYGNDFVLTRNSGEYNIFIEGASGNVGINTSTPGARLDVNGNLKFSGALMPNNLPGTSGYVLKSNGAGTAPTWVDVNTLITPGLSSNSWLLTGNSGLTDNTNNFLGTNDNTAINFRYGGNKAGRIDAANSFFGSYAGYQNINASTLNTGMGYHALYSNTQGTRNTAIGYGALQNNTGTDNIGVGYAAETNSTTNSIAIGKNTYITASYGIAIGDAAQTATNTYATAIGASSYATGNNSVSLGSSAQSAAAYSLALGANAYTSAPYSVALGQAAQTNTNNYAIAIGTNSYSSGVGSIAIGGAVAGSKVQAQGTNSLSIGSSAYSGGTNAISIGVSTNTAGNTSAIAVGASAYGGGTNAAAFGTSANANGNYNTAIGPSALANGTNSTAIGYNTNANANNATALGYNANAVNPNTVVIGDASNTAVYTGLGIATPLYKLHVVAPSNPLFLAGVLAGGNSDSVLTILNGVVRKLPSTSFLTGSTGWSLTGNSGTNINSNFLGTIDAQPFAIRTNNTEKMRINTAGNVGIGTSTFDVNNPEQLLVDAGRTNSVNVISGKGSIDSYLQLNIQNRLAGASASSDVVATADNGDEFSNFIDLGINSSANTSGFFGNANDAYLYAAGNDFILGNGTANKSLIFLTNGGSVASNERMRILSNGNIGIANTTPTQKLDVNGNVKFSGALMPNNLAGTSGYLLTSTGAGTAPVWSAPSSVIGSVGWALGGNAVSSLQNFGTTTNYAVPVITNNIERMRVDVNGNVGIGTTAPSAALNVVKNSSGTNIITIQNTNTSGFSSMDFYSSGGTLSSTFGFANSTTGGIFSNRAYMNSYNNDFVLTRNSGEYSIFIEGATGNIGIGTNTPGAKLDISGNLKFSGALMPNNLPGTSGYILASSGAGVAPVWSSPGTITSAYSWALGGNALTSQQNFGTTTNFAIPFVTNNTEKMRLTAAGYLGINTTAPETPFHVIKTSTTSSYTPPDDVATIETTYPTTTSVSQPPVLNLIRQVPNASYVANTNIYGPIISFNYRNPGNSATDFAQIQSYSYNSSSMISFATKNNMINANPNGATSTFGGNLSIPGTTANTSAMLLNGNILSVGNLTGFTTGGLSADAAGEIIRTPSDMKLKTNITAIHDALKKVMSIHGVNYNFKDTKRFGSQREMGFVAQDIEKVIPEVVNNGIEYKSVNYQVLTALLTEAIKEQQKQIENQTKKNQALQQTVDTQQKQIEELIQRVSALEKK